MDMKKSNSADFGRLLQLREHAFKIVPLKNAKTLACGRLDHSKCWSSEKNLEALIHGPHGFEKFPDFSMCGDIIIPSEDQEFLNDCSTMKVQAISEKRKWTVGKVSAIMLILFSLTDIILNLVDAQMDSLVAPDHYDALSADVIRPAFRYHSSSNERIPQRPRLGLGSAAISSVTTALSPILPFTGGLDLRREDYWTNGLFGSVASVLEQVREAFSGTSVTETNSNFMNIPRGGASVAVKAPRSKIKKVDHISAISSAEPFVPLKDIAELTLKDVSMAFRYAIESTRPNFNAAKFIASLLPRVKKVVEKVSTAASTSRGKSIVLPITGVSHLTGDIDALQFCAAMRIFAEWRVLRQVPDGYKGYAVGMNLGQKDIVQNVAKIEHAVHGWIDHQMDLESVDVRIHSPTLRDLLQFEAETGVHDKLPRLKEKSAAMGLLWVTRQLHYQTALFANVIQVPQRFDTVREAITAAYNEVYDKYHGWAVQKIFNYSFQAAPDATEIYKVMNPERLKEVTETAKRRMAGEVNHSRQSKQQKNEEENPLERFGKHVGREWDKFAGSVMQLFGQKPPIEIDIFRGGSDAQENLSMQIEIENFINQEMDKDAHEHIVEYLHVVEPLLKDLAKLFDEFNMDDPSKV